MLLDINTGEREGMLTEVKRRRTVLIRGGVKEAKVEMDSDLNDICRPKT